MIKRLILIAAAFVALGGAVGCGGGGGGETTAAPVETTEEAALSKGELISKGDAICAEVNAAVGTMTESASTNTAARVAQEADLYGGMVERLKGLGAPAEEEGSYREFLTAAEQLDQAESDARLAAERGEEEALEEAEASSESALSAFQQSAENYGFEECAEGPHAPTPTSPAEEGGEAAPEEVEEAAPEEVEEAAPEEEAAPPVEEEAGGGAGPGGGTETPSGGSGGGSSGGIGPG